MAAAHGLPASRSLSYEKAEMEGQRVRGILGLNPRERIPSGTRLFESLEGYTYDIAGTSFGLTYGVSESLLTEAQAELEPESGNFVIQLSEEAYAGLENDLPRSRFSVCHEIAHVVLHYPELMKLSRIPHTHTALLRSSSRTHPVYFDTEWQANAFAAAFLMPAIALKEMENQGQLTSSSIQEEFVVSYSAALTRMGVYSGRRRLLLH